MHGQQHIKISISCWSYRYVHHFNQFSLSRYTGTIRAYKY